MVATKTRAAVRLPPVTVARLKEAMAFIERLAEENTDVFVASANRYRERHRNGTSRALTAVEAAQVAAGLAAGVNAATADDAVAVQESGLRAYDEPDPREVLLAAGIATAPAFLDIATRFTALVEMPADTFAAAREDETLDDAIAAAAAILDDLEVTEARARATAALEHFAAAAGAQQGKALGLLTQTVWTALQNALRVVMDERSTSSSLIDSAANTTGLGETSSTA